MKYIWVLFIGVSMMGLTIAIHAFGSAKWLNFISQRKLRLFDAQSHASLYSGTTIILTTVVLLSLHLVEILMWAAFFFLLPGQSGLEGFHEAIYFSLVTFTTLGYGDVTLSESWRVLSGFEAMIGITVFGLTTATLFSVMQTLWHETHGKK